MKVFITHLPWSSFYYLHSKGLWNFLLLFLILIVSTFKGKHPMILSTKLSACIRITLEPVWRGQIPVPQCVNTLHMFPCLWSGESGLYLIGPVWRVNELVHFNTLNPVGHNKVKLWLLCCLQISEKIGAQSPSSWHPFSSFTDGTKALRGKSFSRVCRFFIQSSSLLTLGVCVVV